MTNYKEYYNTITNELVSDFGKGILSTSLPSTALTIRQCQVLNNKYGFDKAMIIAKRYASIVKAN